MNFKEAKEYITKAYDALNSGAVYAEGSEQHKTIVEICTLARIEFKNCTCKFADRMMDTVAELMLFFKKNEAFSKCSFEMARGVVYVLEGVAYSHKNLTDDVAERLLAERPDTATKHIKFVGKAEEEHTTTEKADVKTNKKARR